jgi:hypothetical protein
LHLAPEVGKISLADCRLIEDPNDKDDDNNPGDMEIQDGNNEGAVIFFITNVYDQVELIFHSR